MTNTINIDFDSLKAEAKRVLSLYGKRRKDNQGNTLFAGITTSSNEASTLDDFVWKGLEIFLGELSPMVAGHDYTNGKSVTFTSNRINATKEKNFELNLRGFVVSYVLMKALNISGLVNEEKEAEADMQRHLTAAIKLIYDKTPPSASTKSLNDMTGSIELDE